VAVAAVNPTHSPLASAIASPIRREVYFLNLFRVLEAAIIVGLMFSPLAITWVVSIVHPLSGRSVAIVYLIFAWLALSFGTRSERHQQAWICVSLAVDIAVCALAMFSIKGQFNSLAMLLLVNVGGAALLLPPRIAFLFAALATFGMLGQGIAGNLIDLDDRDLLQSAIFGLAYFSVTALCMFLAQRVRESDALASERGSALNNLSQLNELIIRRMKTGVLVVDQAGRVRRWNESAWALIGNPSHAAQGLSILAPELSRRLYHWRSAQKIDNTPVALADGAPEVIPRFARLTSNDDSNVLIFLDDTSLVSRRAEQLTLTSLGRLSASIAHEIRNPLTAISYSAQLLAESDKIDVTEQRLVEIIRNHCGRVNEIVENILHLARRERSLPESLDLALWATRFVDEYKSTNNLGGNLLALVLQSPTAEVLADPQQLQQMVWNLVQNAMRYGRLPNQPARVSLVVRHSAEKNAPTLEVIDRGPGIPPKVAARIFDAFFTTHEFGTGLGLYLARQMCEASQCTLEYLPVAGGGSCFRITFPAMQTPIANVEASERGRTRR
jgi:two-component system sensor histidine kinase PilS (NtrC family)